MHQNCLTLRTLQSSTLQWHLPRSTVTVTKFHKIHFIIWVKTITLALWKNTPKCVWKPHVMLQDLLNTLIENVILQDLPQNLDENNKILFLFHKISFKAVLSDTKNVAFQDLLSKLERTFFHKICFDILECGNNYLREGKDRNPWVFANYLEDFCHRLKLRMNLNLLGIKMYQKWQCQRLVYKWQLEVLITWLLWFGFLIDSKKWRVIITIPIIIKLLL